MSPDTSLWATEAAYDYWDDLALDGLAWEFLRRNGDYQRDFVRGNTDAISWGLRCAVDPSRSAKDQPVFWAPTFSTADVLLTALPLPAPSDRVQPDPLAGHLDRNAAYGAIGHGASELHLSFVEAPTRRNETVCIVIPLDMAIPERIEAVQRLWRLLQNHPAPDQRLSHDKRNRLRQVVRASDGQACGATQRQIAESLFGGARVSDEYWKTSSLRYVTQRLLRDGQRLIGGGYRELLFPRSPEMRKKRVLLSGVRK